MLCSWLQQRKASLGGRCAREGADTCVQREPGCACRLPALVGARLCRCPGFVISFSAFSGADFLTQILTKEMEAFVLVQMKSVCV